MTHGIPRHRERPTRRVNPSGKIRWVARYTGPDGKRRSAGTFRLEREAQDAIDAAYALPRRQDTIASYLPKWLEEHPVSERTTRTNRGRIRAVLNVGLEGVELGDWAMRDLRRRHAKDLVAHMLTVQGRAPEGARNILRALSAMAEDAIGDELTELNPWKGVKVRDDDKRAVKHSREPRVWTFDEMHEFASYAGAYEPMLRVMADCGLRVGEVFAVLRSSLQLADEIIEIRGSAWEGQVVPSSREKNHHRDAPLSPAASHCCAKCRRGSTRRGCSRRRLASYGATATGTERSGSPRLTRPTHLTASQLGTGGLTQPRTTSVTRGSPTCEPPGSTGPTSPTWRATPNGRPTSITPTLCGARSTRSGALSDEIVVMFASG